MTTKTFKGKAIYQPKNKAAEYSAWACNFYVGCSNGCTYCYCKKGILAGAMGQDKPQLKKCFKDEKHALEVFEKELLANVDELRKHGLFFSFTTDPMLPETQTLTMNAAGIAVKYGVQVKILTKCASWVKNFIWWINNSNSDNEERDWRKNYAFGFTLTGHDELEKGASTNQERIEAMLKLHVAGFKTWASIEPIVDFESSLEMIEQTCRFCDLYKIGLESGKKYSKYEITKFIDNVNIMFNDYYKNYCEYTCPFHKGPDNPFCRGCNFYLKSQIVYFKDSLLKAAGIARESLPSNCVPRDYNIFNQ